MNRLNLLFVLLVLSLTAQAGTPKLPKEKDLQAYLMVYHKDQDHGLHMAVSEDGYTWTALNDDKPIFDGDTIAVQHGIRDPHIFRGPDGAFYLFIRCPIPDAKEFCEHARKYGLLLVPSNDFGITGYARAAYCVKGEMIRRSLPAFRSLAQEYGLC